MLVLLSGVSGAGKDTIKKELIRRNENITSISFTIILPLAKRSFNIFLEVP